MPEKVNPDEEILNGETWVLNNTLTFTNFPITSSTDYKNCSFYRVDGSCNSATFEYLCYDSLGTYSSDGSEALGYASNIGANAYTQMYTTAAGWTNEAYRTITFATAPTGDLLTWLQANGTKQSTSTPTFKHFYDAGTIGTGAVKFRHYSQQEPTPQLPKVSIRYDDDYVSGYIAYSLDNGATWSDYITTQTTLLTDVTQIKFKCKGLDGGLIIVKGVYNTVDTTGTDISPGYPTDREAYETENITITEDTGFYYYCYYD